MRYQEAMPSGRGDSLADLPEPIRALLDNERRAVMSTVESDGAAHSVPVVFAVVGAEIVSPIDHKPKSGKIMRRVRNIERDDRVTLLIDHWTEEWTHLAWLMVRGSAHVDDAYPDDLLHGLNDRYEQYERDERHDALVRIRPRRLLWWSWT